MELQDLKFIDEIQSLGGEIYSVGGKVRDEILGLESKDLDVLITAIPMDELQSIISKYGKVDAVGKSFGVLKFTPKGADMDVDIAIPRTEKPNGEGGHKGFEVISDHTLSIEEDLLRRDFTINAIAKGLDGNLIDPYGGLEDIRDKIIRVVDEDAFADDPLRMLRAIQFAARFDGFRIVEKTEDLIVENAHRIKEIAGERIVEEFKKVITKKGDVLYTADLLRETGLYQEIFGEQPTGMWADWWDRDEWEDVETLSEFLFMLTEPIGGVYNIQKSLVVDNKALNEATHFQIIWRNHAADALPHTTRRILLSKLINKTPWLLKSKLIPDSFKTIVNEFNDELYPKGFKELEVNGNDLMEIGLQGKGIGECLDSILIHIYSDKISNNKKDLLNFAKSFNNG